LLSLKGQRHSDNNRHQLDHHHADGAIGPRRGLIRSLSWINYDVNHVRFRGFDFLAFARFCSSSLIAKEPASDF
jgi:hypothetical protein